jgi:hypothetical protein
MFFENMPDGWVLRVRDWNELYETHRTRPLKNLDWVPIPNTMDGDGYTELVDHPNAAAHLGAWLVILQIASKCDPRGTLLRHVARSARKTAAPAPESARSHTPQSLSRISRLPVTAFEEAIPRLLDIGWLETSEISDLGDSEKSARKTAAPAPESARSPLEIARPALENVYGREGNEWKGMEAPLRNCALSHDQPAEPQSLNGPFEWFAGLWRGGINGDCWRVFGETVNTPDRLAALQANVPLWARTKRYGDGFTDANTFLRSGIWLLPPKPELLPVGDVFDRAAANLSDEEL